MKKILPSFLFCFLTCILSAEKASFSLFELVQGGSVEARLIEEKVDRYFVDLGYTVLSIPKDAVLSVHSKEKVKEEAGYTDDLYRESTNLASSSVRELASSFGDAVVTVRTPVGMGSGFFINPEGYVITNDHVIAGEHEISITVFTQGLTGSDVSKKQYNNVRIVASSENWDLALLKIEDTEGVLFNTVSLNNDDSLQEGQAVFAIGNPLGLERSVSEGIVSQRNRIVDGRLFIQTTTQINPGNSGGPLFNLQGEVVGVNNMKVVAFGAEGLGFAIPVDVLKRFLHNRDAFAFDARNPNRGFRYNSPPMPVKDDQ